MEQAPVKLSLCCIFYSLASTICAAQQPSPTIPRFTVQLNDPPRRRWDPVFDSLGPARLAEFNTSATEAYVTAARQLGAGARDAIDRMAALDTYADAEYIEEMHGIADKLGQPFEVLLFFNAFYELSEAYGCTTVIAHTEGGTVLGYNMDFYNIGELKLRDLLIVVDYKYGQRTQYTAVTILGLVGVTFGVHPGGFAYSNNARYEGSITANLQSIMQGAKLVMVQLRHALNQSDFEAALDLIQSSSLAGPAYISTAGVARDDGMVVAKDGNQPRATYSKSLDSARYLVQTNRDTNWDASSRYCGRFDQANSTMSKLVNITRDDIFQILSTGPVLNKRTFFTAVVEPRSGYLDVTLRVSSATIVWLSMQCVTVGVAVWSVHGL